MIADRRRKAYWSFTWERASAPPAAADAAAEPVLSMSELARELNVSTKTISRWCRQGLAGRRLVCGGRRKIVFARSAVEQFVALNRRRVERGARFSRLRPEEHQGMIEQARRLEAAGAAHADAVAELARATGRCAETVRSAIRRHNRQHPESAVYAEASGPVRPEIKRAIYQLYRRGESAEALARRFGRSRSSIRRIILEMRIERIRELPLGFVPNPKFAGLRSEREVSGPAPAADPAPKPPRLPEGLPPYLASLYHVPLLTREQEVHLFRKMNYLKYKAAQLRGRLDPARAKASLLDRIERLHEESVAVKNQIISANLRLVVSIAKRHVGPGADFFELVSDGNISLIRAVEKFDFARGNRFSTYASWAIMKNFARSIPDAHRQRQRFRTGVGELFGAREDVRTDQRELEQAQSQRERTVRSILQRLDPREQQIITCRFGLERDREPLTLKEVGAVMGVTKERIRQIEARTMRKLQAAFVEGNLELPG